MNRIRVSKIIIVSAAAVLSAVFAFVSFAGSSLLTPGTSRTIAGSSFDFTLNVKSLDSDSSNIEAEDVTREYVIALSVSPEVSSLSVKEGVGTVNAVTGEYQVTSSQLGDTGVLHFSVTPSENITSETTYTVSVNVSGDVSASDSFNLIVVPKEVREATETPAEQIENTEEAQQTEESQQTEEQQAEEPQQTEEPQAEEQREANGYSQEATPQQSSEMTSNRTMPSTKMSGKKFSMSGAASGIASSGSLSSDLIYAGSWDNYLDALSIDGYEFTRQFNKTRDTYFVTVPLKVTSLTIDATPSDASASVAITGDTDLPEGRSKIMVSITADDGSVRVYRIYVDRTDQPEESENAEEPGSPEQEAEAEDTNV